MHGQTSETTIEAGPITADRDDSNNLDDTLDNADVASSLPIDVELIRCYERTTQFLECAHEDCPDCIAKLSTPECPFCCSQLTTFNCLMLTWAANSENRYGLFATYEIPTDHGLPVPADFGDDWRHVDDWSFEEEEDPTDTGMLQQMLDFWENSLSDAVARRTRSPRNTTLVSSRHPRQNTLGFFMACMYPNDDLRRRAYLSTTRLGPDEEGILVDSSAYDILDGTELFDRMQMLLIKFCLKIHTSVLEKKKAFVLKVLAMDPRRHDCCSSLARRKTPPDS